MLDMHDVDSHILIFPFAILSRMGNTTKTSDNEMKLSNTVEQ